MPTLKSHPKRYLAAAVPLLLALSLRAQLPAAQLPASLLPAPPPPAPGSLAEAKQALGEHHFELAKRLYSKFLQTHPGSGEAELGLGDAELGLHEYEAAELQYRSLVAAQPQLWIAHKNLVIVEAALGRWSEFDRERALLRDARKRNAPGITAHESDVIDTFDVRGRHWIVREYDDLAGRSLTRYNFEQFGPDGRIAEYISLESAAAAQKALQNQDVVIGATPRSQPRVDAFALNDYTGRSHGTIARYPDGEPSYETVRVAVMRWLQRPHQARSSVGPRPPQRSTSAP